MLRRITIYLKVTIAKEKYIYFNMDKSTIFVIVLLAVALSIRLYSKFAKKETGKTGSDSRDKLSGQSKSGEDEYEPYSKK